MLNNKKCLNRQAGNILCRRGEPSRGQGPCAGPARRTARPCRCSPRSRDTSRARTARPRWSSPSAGCHWRREREGRIHMKPSQSWWDGRSLCNHMSPNGEAYAKWIGQCSTGTRTKEYILHMNHLWSICSSFSPLVNCHLQSTNVHCSMKNRMTIV